MATKKFITLYKRWMKTGKLPGESGLCQAFNKSGLSYDLLEEEFLTEEEYYKITNRNGGYFASINSTGECGKFTPLRQNIVLLMACLNGEL